MKKSNIFVSAIMLAIATSSGALAQFSALTPPNIGLPGGQDYVLDVPMNPTWNRIGHLQSGTYGDPSSQWAAIGVPNLNFPPANNNYYGFFSNWQSDRAFFGLRKDGVYNNSNAMIAFGDNHDNDPVPNRLIFQFDSFIPSFSKEIGTMLANGNVGFGTSAPTAQLEVNSIPTLGEIAIKGFGKSTGIYGEATDMTVGQTAEGVLAGWKEAIGVFGKGTYATNSGNGNTFGVVGSASATNPLNNVGVYGEAKNANGYNTGVYGAVVSDNATGIYNTGVGGRVYQNNTATWNRAVSGQAPVAPKHFAGYFDGNMSVMSGNAGINTETPRHKLQVHDGALMLSGNVAGFGGPQLLFSDDTTTHPNGKWAIEYIKPIAGTGPGTRPSMGGLNFWKPWNATNPPGLAYNYTLFLKDDGKVGMGVTDENGDANFCATALPNGYRLYVNGGILTTKVKVANYCSAAWADYVFAKDYKLKSLSEVEAFVKENKHLPNIPSATEIEKEGLDLADMQSLQMAKIEELTLYMIEMKKEIDALKNENKSLKINVSPVK